jgi:hypothetical protein
MYDQRMNTGLCPQPRRHFFLIKPQGTYTASTFRWLLPLGNQRAIGNTNGWDI